MHLPHRTFGLSGKAPGASGACSVIPATPSARNNKQLSPVHPAVTGGHPPGGLDSNVTRPQSVAGRKRKHTESQLGDSVEPSSVDRSFENLESRLRILENSVQNNTTQVQRVASAVRGEAEQIRTIMANQTEQLAEIRAMMAILVKRHTDS